jgi:orotate phosphoribosyltransferase
VRETDFNYSLVLVNSGSMSLYDDFELVSSGPQLGARGYAFRLSRPISADFLNNVAITFSHLIENPARPLHLIAIANSGVPLATAILMHRYIKREQPSDWLSVVDPNRLERIAEISSRQATALLIDNSINSGKTLINILHKLHANGLQVSTLVKLVDYEDAFEDGDRRALRDNVGVMTLSLYTKTSIVESCDPRYREDMARLVATRNDRARV